jgi:CheY-like chemotaxis protein
LDDIQSTATIMDTELKILLVEDSETDADLLFRFLKKEKIEFSHSRVWNKDGFIKALNDEEHDIIISDQSLPQFSGMEAFRISKNENKDIPFILVTGTVSEKLLTEFAKEGIDDYLLKENLLRLPSAIKHAISKKKIEQLHKKLEIAHKDINDSIHYAKKIQNSMLPDTAMLQDNFPESFILFKPKDVLSGDFYWFKK